MSKYALAGVDLDSMLVDIVASFDSKFAENHIKEIVDAKLLPVVTTMALAKEHWGEKIESLDVLQPEL